MKHSTLSIICLVAILCIGLAAPLAMADDGRRASATVSFGQWQTDPPLDRFDNLSPRNRNNHQLIPHKVKIKAGGAVNFIIGGFHNPIIYDVGTQPEDIDVNDTIPTTGTPAGVPLINDPTNRIYRGQDPSLQPLLQPSTFPGPDQIVSTQDRVEVVVFPKPGTYLVICGVRPHFVNDGMFGFVKVRPADDDD
jgi:plastocyanin